MVNDRSSGAVGARAFDLNSQAGVMAVLAAARSSGVSAAERNELRDLVFLYTNGGGDQSVRIALEQKLDELQLVPATPSTPTEALSTDDTTREETGGDSGSSEKETPSEEPAADAAREESSEDVQHEAGDPSEDAVSESVDEGEQETVEASTSAPLEQAGGAGPGSAETDEGTVGENTVAREPGPASEPSAASRTDTSTDPLGRVRPAPSFRVPEPTASPEQSAEPAHEPAPKPAEPAPAAAVENATRGTTPPASQDEGQASGAVTPTAAQAPSAPAPDRPPAQSSEHTKAPAPAAPVSPEETPTSKPSAPAAAPGAAGTGPQLARIREIKKLVNEKVGNPVKLVELDSAVGREYMNALLDAMKKLSGGAAGGLDSAMERLEAAYSAVERVVKERGAPSPQPAAPSDAPPPHNSAAAKPDPEPQRAETPPSQPAPEADPGVSAPIPVASAETASAASSPPSFAPTSMQQPPQAPPQEGASSAAPGKASETDIMPPPDPPPPQTPKAPATSPSKPDPATRLDNPDVPTPNTESTPQADQPAAQPRQADTPESVAVGQDRPVQQPVPPPPAPSQPAAATAVEQPVVPAGAPAPTPPPQPGASDVVPPTTRGPAATDSRTTNARQNRAAVAGQTPAASGITSLAHSKTDWHTPQDLPTADSVSTGEAGDPLFTKEVDDGLDQLLSDWDLFKRSGLFGTGPNGREHPLYKKIANLQIPLLLAGRFEGANQEIKQSVTDYMNGWRYEQGIIYEQGETFEHYLRRVIRHILDLQKKNAGA